MKHNNQNTSPISTSALEDEEHIRSPSSELSLDVGSDEIESDAMNGNSPRNSGTIHASIYSTIYSCI